MTFVSEGTTRATADRRVGLAREQVRKCAGATCPY
jgi:hypothetical protein